MLFRESRLIGLTPEQLAAMRKAGGVNTTNQIQYGSRQAQANAQLQNDVRLNNLLNQQGKTSTFLDAQGVDTRKDASGNMTLDGTLREVKTTGALGDQSALRSALNPAASQNASRILAQSAQAGNTITTDRSGNVIQTSASPRGKIAESAFNRLTGAGKTAAEANTFLDSQQYRQGVQQAFNTGMVDTSTLQPTTIAGVAETPEMFAQRKAAIEAQNAAKMQQKTEMENQARNRATSNAASAAAGTKAADSATPGATPSFATVEDLVDHYRKKGTDEQTIRSLVDQYNQQKTPSPEQQGQISGIESLIGTLTPEQRQYLEPMLRAQMQALGQSNALAGATFGNDMQAAKDNYETTNAQLQAAADMNVKLQKDLDAISQQMRDSSLENIAKQQKVNEERLQWEQTKRERELRNDERKAVDRKIGEMALIGGFGSYASGQVVDEVRNNFETAISDLAIEFGLQRSEAAVRFSAQHNDIMNQYRADTINSLTTLTAKLEQIGGQFASNKIAKTNAEKKAWDDFVKVQTTNEKEKANLLSGVAKEAYAMIVDNRDEKVKQESLGWQRLQQAITTYGQDVPQPMLESIGKLLPGVNVSEVVRQPTLAQQKKMRSVSSGLSGGVSRPFFSISERDSTGKPISKDDWLSTKIAAFNASQAGPVAPGQVKAWEKEYKAKMAQEQYLSPSSILKELRKKQAQTGSFGSVTQFETTEKNIMEALKTGDYQGARDILDNVGARPPERTIAQVTSAQRVINDLNRMEILIDSVEDKIGAFPTKGPLWQWMNENIETTPEYAELRQLMDANLAPYSRGVTGERGATTEPDVQRALSSLLSPNVDAPAARAQLRRARQMAQESASIYLQGMRDGGYRVKNLQDTYEANYSATTAPVSSDKQNWLNQFK